jgi:predicted ATPase/DNA-binding XRE family transcriptional regulator
MLWLAMAANDESLATLLKRHRAAAALTQEELAERAGISSRSISDIERGLRKSIYRDTATRLAEALQLHKPQRQQFESIAIGRLGVLRDSRAALQGPSGPDVPIPPTRLIGREQECQAIRAALGRSEVRLLTLIGPGGVGKTRLALEIADSVHFDDGAVFVSLGSTTDVGLVPSVMADALGVVSGDNSPTVALTKHLSDRELLLVLDTFEHLLDAAPLISELLAASPRVSALVTSRAPLRLRGEHEFPVGPLELPRREGHPEKSPAVALFFERAHAVNPGLIPEGEIPFIVADICRTLEGLPLAIELAAARVRHLPLAALRDHLRHQLDLLTGGPRDLPPRQRAMRDTVAWSYRLLDREAQWLFAELSVFAGGWTLEAARAVSNLAREDPLGATSALVDEGLAVVADTRGEPRFRMLDVIREFAVERREEAGVSSEIERRHAEYFTNLVEDAERQLGGALQEEWLRRLDAERHNIRAALRWTIDTREVTLAIRIAGAHWRAWQVRGDLAEGRSWLREALGIDPTPHSQPRTKALWGAAWLALHQGDYDEAQKLSDDLLVIQRSQRDPIGTRNALTIRGMVAMSRDRPAAAIPPLRECVDICRVLGRSWHLATSLLNLAQPMMQEGDLAAAESLLQEALQIYREVGDHRFEARAVEYLGHTALLARDTSRAQSLFRSSLREFASLGDRGGMAEGLAGLAAAAAADGRAVLAAQLAAASHATRETLGARALPFERIIIEPFLRTAREQAGEHAWHQAWDEGLELTAGRAIELSVSSNEDSDP